ncbi:cytochrome P450 [Aspergillus coremiiformis]|uniref:Cytochrome P450 n=1 Tax=Aspergillus coremiiformis TaxID=138285 RepID=A0A5N6YZC3_9EURO|nr:cytochrome P450 [Aspergillus coremiiformis]
MQFIVSFILFCLRRLMGLWYLIRGPEIIGSAYISANGKPFRVPTPSNDHVLITSNDHIRELIDAPHQNLSLHAVAKEILQPKYTMHGFEWQDQRGVEGTGFVRALRSRLTAHLPAILPDLQRIVNSAIADELSVPSADGFIHVRLFAMIKRTVTNVNCFTFFGEELSQNAEFTTAALEFPQTVVLAAEVLRITPNFLRGYVASLVTGGHSAAKTIFRYLEPIVQQRLALRVIDGGSSQTHAPVDCMQWLIDTSPRKTPWSTPRMVGEIMAVWFGSVHQLAMTTTYAIEDLCLHMEYIEPLRSEIHQYSANSCGRNVEKMPLLDSFIKESIRCTNSDAITVRRKALTPFVFRDGLQVDRDDWVCIPQRGMMYDPSRYSDPAGFDGFRFARANKILREGYVPVEVPDRVPSILTDVSADWPIWGLGNTACPGRFYASTILKLILVCILDEWDCRLLAPNAPRSRTWRSSIVPRESTVILFHRRNNC